MNIQTRDTFRPVKRGDVEIDVNSKMATGSRFVDRSRLRKEACEEYIPPATPNGMGRYERTTKDASIMDNARRGADAMKHKSSFSNEDDDQRDGFGGCCPSPFYGGSGPLTKKRGDE